MDMAQTGSAQREPSMEEILASIRRIIEDSDAVRSPDDDRDLDAELVEAAANTQSGTVNEVAAFRAGLEEHALPDVAANAPAIDAAESTSSHPPVQRAAEVRAFQVQPPILEPVVHDSPLDPLESEPEAAPNEQVAEAPAPLVDSLSATDESKPSLMSVQAGRQVAAAFGELSEVFAASRRRSFDEIAEEMLRPMLQEWLDNNLPTLVEKLVREEIERVARGG